MEDWGESKPGGDLAQLREVHNHRKDERRFQVQVLLIFSAITAGTVILQACNASVVAKDILLTVLPVFTFVLGKLETKNG